MNTGLKCSVFAFCLYFIADRACLSVCGLVRCLSAVLSLVYLLADCLAVFCMFICFVLCVLLSVCLFFLVFAGKEVVDSLNNPDRG